MPPEKHEPLVLKAIPRAGGGASVAVVVRGTDGSTGYSSLHPMGSSHYITTIYVKDETGSVVYLKQFDPASVSSASPPIMEFNVGPASTVLTPYEYCNLHGLWKGPSVTVPFQAKADSLLSTVSASIATGPTSAHNASLPPIKHDPAVTSIIKNADGSHVITFVTRGTEGSSTSLHPNTPSHWITTMWLTDQTGNLVYLEEFPQPTSSQSSTAGTYTMPTVRFTLPGTHPATELTPWEYCNLHGLWQGPKVAVAATSGQAPAAASPSPPMTGLGDLSPGSSAFVVISTMFAMLVGIGIIPDLLVKCQTEAWKNSQAKRKYMGSMGGDQSALDTSIEHIELVTDDSGVGVAQESTTTTTTEAGASKSSKGSTMDTKAALKAKKAATLAEMQGEKVIKAQEGGTDDFVKL